MRSLARLFPRSVRGRLWAALAMLSISVIVVSALTWLALQRVDARLQELHRQSLTRVAEAIDLSKRSSDLVASAPYLLTQRSNYLIEQEGAKLLSVLREVRQDWPEAAGTGDRLPEASVVEITRRMETGVRDLMTVAEALEAMQSDLRKQLARLGSLREKATQAIQNESSATGGVLVWWTLKSMNADVLNAAYAGNLIGVGEEQRHFQRQRSLIDRSALTAEQAVFLNELDQIVTGPAGLFEQRRQELALQLQAQNALFRIRRDANGINEAASDFAARAEAVLTVERSDSSTMIQVTRLSVAAISLASLALALVAALFVSRYVASNVARVSAAMVRLASGDRAPMLPRRLGGDDEIGDLFRSYRFFRANALRLDRSNRQLDQRNALFEKVFANISDGVVITDSAGLITASNPTFDRIFRISEAHRPSVPFVHWLSRTRFAQAVADAGLKITHRGFAELKSEDGQILELRSSRLPDEGRVWLIADVTERRKLSERVEQIDRIETLGKVAGDTAHDFGNILSTIRTHAHLLTKKAPQALVANIAAIENAVDFGTSLTDRLLAFSKKQRLTPEVVDLNRLVAGLVDLAEIGLKDGVELLVSYAEEPLRVLADPGQLESALLNLILNANNAIHTEGTIRLELSENRANEAQIIVNDNGSGMSASVRLRAIEPFFTTRAKEGGTGLGLSIVYGFIRQSGGNIEIDSQEGQYTSIRITLPLAREIEEQPGGRLRGRALVIDDDPADLEVALKVCGALGYDSRGCASAQEAHSALRDCGFDLVVSDLDLGAEEDGAELLRRIDRQHPGTRCILVSARSGVQEDAGTRFISKPLTVAKLGDAVGASPVSIPGNGGACPVATTP